MSVDRTESRTVLLELAGKDVRAGREAAIRLVQLARSFTTEETDLMHGLKAVLIREWSALATDGRSLVDPLAEVLESDSDLLRREMAAAALGAQGSEVGPGILWTKLDHDR